MPVERNPNLPQINAGQMLYGEIPEGLLPTGPNMDQTTFALGMPIWDGVQWHIAYVAVAGGIDITYNSGTNTVEFYYGANRTYGVAFGDAILSKTSSASLTADAVLV